MRPDLPPQPGGRARGAGRVATGPLPASRSAVALGAILLVGLALRLLGLGSESLWFDEGITVSLLRAPLAEMLAASDRPPLYYVILHPWTRLSGASEFAVRLPSALFGLATVYLTHRLGAVLFERRVGLIAAAMVALSLFQIRYSQEARNYMLMCMLARSSPRAAGNFGGDRL